MASNPATADDLVDRSLRSLTDTEKVWGGTRLDDAFAQLVAQMPSVATRLDAVVTDLTFRRLVVQVLCAMVLRVLGNPDGKLQETVDDYTYRLDASVSTGALYVTDAELELLAAGDGLADNAFTISPHRTVGNAPWWMTSF